jgi:hypothetical protein
MSLELRAKKVFGSLGGKKVAEQEFRNADFTCMHSVQSQRALDVDLWLQQSTAAT